MFYTIIQKCMCIILLHILSQNAMCAVGIECKISVINNLLDTVSIYLVKFFENCLKREKTRNYTIHEQCLIKVCLHRYMYLRSRHLLFHSSSYRTIRMPTERRKALLLHVNENNKISSSNRTGLTTNCSSPHF